MPTPLSDRRVRAEHRPSYGLARGDRSFVYAVMFGLWTSGILWWLVHRFGVVEGDFGPIAHPTEHPLLVVHGILAGLALASVGLVWIVHIRRAWRDRRNRWLGGTMIVVTVLLAVTGWILYYASGEGFRATSATVHLGVGVAAPLIVIGHIWVGRRTRRRIGSVDRPLACPLLQTVILSSVP